MPHKMEVLCPRVKKKGCTGQTLRKNKLWDILFSLRGKFIGKFVVE
jgi:hypothetical protein